MRHDYHCNNCGKTYERDYGFSEVRPSKVKCECGSSAKHVICGKFSIKYTAQPK